MVRASGTFNHEKCKIQIPSNFNFPFLEQQLADYHDKDLIQFLKYGFPRGP